MSEEGIDYKTQYLLLKKDIEIQKLKDEIQKLKFETKTSDEKIYTCKARYFSRDYINLTLERYRGKLTSVKFNKDKSVSFYMKIYQTAYHQINVSGGVYSPRERNQYMEEEFNIAHHSFKEDFKDIELNKKYYFHIGTGYSGPEYQSFSVEEFDDIKQIEK
jgi:hypothetical protein